MAMVMMPLMTNGLNQLPTRLNPHGTAVNNTAQQVSGSIGSYSCYDYEFCNKNKS